MPPHAISGGVPQPSCVTPGFWCVGPTTLAPSKHHGLRGLPCSLTVVALEGLPVSGPWQVSAGSLGVGCWEPDICGVFLLLDKLNQLNRPHQGGREPSEWEGGGSRAKGTTQHVCGSISPARVQGEEAGGMYPLPGCLGQGPSMPATEKEGLGAKASQGCWSKLQGVTHFSAQNADLLGFSAICPTDPWGHILNTAGSFQWHFVALTWRPAEAEGSTQERGGCLGRLEEPAEGKGNRLWR